MSHSVLDDLQLSPLMIGTAQFGLPYGVANTSGQPPFEEVCAILQCAHEGGINCLDTAPGYGESEGVLGRALEATGLREHMTVVSKVLRDVTEDSSAAGAATVARQEVLRSLQRLKLEALPVCLIHTQQGFRFIEALYQLKDEGLIRHVGCSTASPEATLEILRSGLCEAIQIPTSILDRRFSHGEVFREARARNVAIFVRSAYLQGLILMEPEQVPGDLTAVIPALQELRALAGEIGISLEELALRYVLGLEGLTCAVVGVESVQQMQRNVEICRKGKLDPEIQKRAEAMQFDLPDLIFEPWRWQKRMPDAVPLKA